MEPRPPIHFFDLRPYYRGPRRRVCLLGAVKPERGLSPALVKHLEAEMPSLSFTLAPRSDISAVWLCGYERGAQAAVRRLRERYPRALLLVTGRGDARLWQDQATAAGADLAATWPAPYGRLEHLLGGRRAALEHLLGGRRAAPRPAAAGARSAS